jgi:peptidoglycan/xylan/chitin deacetylase (PgdA/CDA1 family)
MASLGAVGMLTAACSSTPNPNGALPGSPSAAPPPAGAAPRATASLSASAAARATAPALASGLPFEISTGPRSSPRVALTFHGQGDPKIAHALLTEAEHAQARVTVLAVGSWLDQYPAMATRVLDGGHELGNHTQNHRAISSMTADQAYTEIARCAARLRQLTGSQGRWFRPSQTKDCTPTVIAQARRAGYSHCLSYDLDSLDYTDPGATAVATTVLDAVGPGSVVSLHFGHTGTIAALTAILDGLQQRGLRAVTSSELLS